MGVFNCAACKAKDEEIQWLRARVEELEKDVLTVADKRAASLRHPQERTEPLAPIPLSPGMARATYYGEPTREEIERGFANGNDEGPKPAV